MATETLRTISEGMVYADEVILQWHRARSGSECWDWRRVIYAYFSPRDGLTINIGKAGRRTVKQRWNDADKKPLWVALHDELGLRRSQLAVHVGKVRLPVGRNLTKQLLEDIESLLIKRIQPWWNIKCRQSRIPRPGMRVLCEGSWPLEKRRFWDVG